MSEHEKKIAAALSAVKKGMPKKLAAKQFGVSRSTIQYKMSDKFKKPDKGPESVLTKEEEVMLVRWVIHSAKRGFPRRRLEITESVHKMLQHMPERKTPFKDKKPGPGWTRPFLRRNPELVERKCENVTPSSACVSEQNLRGWFNSIEEVLKEDNFFDILKDPARVFNGDETNFALNAKNPKVFAEKGQKNVFEIDIGQDKKAVTVMFTFSASGVTVPNMLVLPYKRVPRQIMESVPSSWGIGLSDSGWMQADTFTGYIENVFLPFVKSSGVQLPIILFVDGHRSHLTYQAIELCSNSGIILISLYPNATRILQPADVAAFYPIKAGWKKAILNWRLSKPNEAMTVKMVAPLLEVVLKEYSKKSTLVNGFRACGLFPWNPNALDYSKCLAKPASSQETTSNEDNILNTLSPNQFRQVSGEDMIFHIANLHSIADEHSRYELALHQLYLYLYPCSDSQNNSIEIQIDAPATLLSDFFLDDNGIYDFIAEEDQLLENITPSDKLPSPTQKPIETGPSTSSEGTPIPHFASFRFAYFRSCVAA